MKDILRTSQSARFFREKINAVNSFGTCPYKTLIREFSFLGVEEVIDGGANVGQFGLDIYRHGYLGSLYSYEPINSIFKRLQKTSHQYQNWYAINLGVGLRDSLETINVSGNDGLSSSILQMKETHLSNFPSSRTIATEQIKITSIAEQIRVLNLNANKMAVKLDVQGFEYQALLGAGEFLQDIPICFLELSISSLYEGEHDYLKILSFLASSGHDVCDLYRGVEDKNGALLQIDVVTKNRKFR